MLSSTSSSLPGATRGSGAPCGEAALFASDDDIHAFDDIATSAGIDLTSHAGGAIMKDFDDGRPNLYLSVRGGSHRLFRNDGPVTAGTVRGWKFTDVAQTAGFDKQRNTFATLVDQNPASARG